MTQKQQRITFRRVLAFTWSYWQYYPGSLAGVIAGLLIGTGAQLLQPVLAGRLIDAIATEGQGLEPAIWTLGLMIGVIFIAYLAHVLKDHVWAKLASTCMAKLVQDAFVRTQRFSTEWHANNFAGATVRKMTRGMWAMDLFGDTLVYGFLPTGILTIGMAVVLALQWPVMGLFVSVSLVVYIAANYAMASWYVAPANKLFAEEDSRLTGVLADAVTCNATIKAFAAERREEARTVDQLERWRHHTIRSWGRHVNTMGGQFVVLLIMQGGLLALALWFWSQGQATPGQVTTVLTMYLMLNGYLRELGMHMRHLQQSINDIEDVVDFRDMPLGVADEPDAKQFVPGKGRIRFDQVVFGYANQPVPVYQDFSLDIAPGEKVALVGKSGSGKSTFVKLVQRLHDVNAGAVLIDGQNVRQVTQESLRKAIALVPQDPILFHRSLGENIAYGRPDASQAEIEWAAAKAHADEFIRSLKDGYDTMVGERGVKLSGGERQRVAIARAFLADAPILILDEATSSLDSVTERHIQEAIEELMKGRTTILIAHRLSTIQAVDRILVFSGGSVVEQGTHAELMAKANGQYRMLYLTQNADMAMSA